MVNFIWKNDKFQVVICVERKDGKGEFILDSWSMKA